MEYGKKIISMAPGEEIEGFYLLKTATQRTSANGKPYLNAVLADTTGTIESKMWDYSGQIGPESEGKIVKVRGEVSEYRGTSQLTIRRLRLADGNDSYSLADLVPSAPIDSVKEMEYVQKTVASVEDPDYRKICETMLDRHLMAFGSIPAAKSIHHSFLSGLLMHTSNMLRIADFLSSEIYPDAVDRSLLLAGTLLHDFAKDREFAVTEAGLVSGVTKEGNLLGHLVMGAEEVGRIGEELGIPAEKIMLLKHMILSHHGQPEFGAAVIPCIAEAELLSYIDLIDSRMEIYAETFEKLPVGAFSERIYALDKKIYNHE